MGLMNRLFGSGKSEDETVDVDGDVEFDDMDGVEDSLDESIDGVEEDVEQIDETEDVPQEWESAYKFAEWYLEDEGFADMIDFGEKAMMHKMQGSPMFRDRIQSGLGMVTSIREAKDNIEQIRGNDTGASDYGELADKVEDADRLISGIRSLSGEDEMLVQQGMGLAQEAISAFAERGAGSVGDANVETRTSSDRIE